MYFYSDILARAWNLVKQYRFLWFFGLFTALIMGNGGEIELYFKNISSLTKSDGLLNPNFWLDQNHIDQAQKLFSLQSIQELVILAIAILCFALIIWLVITSQISLMRAAGHNFATKEFTFMGLIKESKKSFWAILGLNVLGKLFIYGLFIVVALPVLSGYLVLNSVAWQSVYLLLSFVILVPLAMLVSFLLKYSAGYIVIKNKHFVEAIKLAWGIFKNNWLISLEMAVLIFILNILVSLIMFVAVLLLTSPFLLMAVLTGATSSLIVFGLFGFFIMIVGVILIGSMFSAFQWLAWTFLFLELEQGKGRAKIIRWFDKK